MVQVGFAKPDNDVVQGNYLTEQLRVGTNATTAEMLPGALVVKDTNDYDVKECTATGIIGWLGYGMTNANYKPATSATAYLVGDYVAVHNGGNFRVRAIITGETIAKGTPLEPAANGLITEAADEGDKVVAHAAESVSTAATTIWVVSNI